MSSTTLSRRSVLKAATAGSASLLGLSAKAADPLILAINEGVTYRTNPVEVQERYQPIIEDLSRILRGPVKAVAVSRYDELQKGLSEHRYAMAYVHPAHHAIRALNNGYRLGALTKGFTEYRASLFVSSNSPIKSLTDLKGEKIGAPDEDSITSVLLRATLRDAGLAGGMKVTYVRYQDAVPFMVEHGLAAAGVSASKTVLKDWQDNGGRVIASSKAAPIKQMLVSSKAPSGTLERVAEYFLGLEQTKEGRSRLESMRVQGFIPFEEDPLKAIGRWIGVA